MSLPYSSTKENPPPSLLLCPLCKQRIPVIRAKINEDGSIQIYTKCFCNDNKIEINSLKDYLSVVKSIKSTENCSNAHEEAKTSIAYCKTCEKHFCKSCLKKHNMEQKAHLNSLSLIKINNNCPNHNDNLLNLFCRTCKISLCNLCLEENKLAHKFHQIEQYEYYDNKLTKRNLYKNYENSKKVYYNIIYIFDLLYQYYDKKGEPFPYIADPINISNKLIDFENFIEMYNLYKENNDLLLEFINSLFITFRIENNAITSIVNLVNNCIFDVTNNSYLCEKDFKEESELSNRLIVINMQNVKYYIHLLIDQMHLLLINPDFYVDIADYVNIKLIINDGIESIKCIKVLSNDQTILVISNNNQIFFYNAYNKKIIKTINNVKEELQTNSLILGVYQLECEDGIFITNTSEIIMYDLITYKWLCSFNISNNKFNNIRIIHILEYSKYKIATCSTDNMIRLFDLKNGIVLSSFISQLGISSICKINDNYFCTGGNIDGNIMIWDNQKSKCIYKITKVHNNSISCLFSVLRKNAFISASYDKSVIVWDSETMESIVTFKELFSSSIKNIIWISNNRIALSEENFFNVWIMDSEDFNLSFKIKHGFSRIIFLQFLKNSNEFISNGDKENEIDIWTFEQ